MKKKEIIKLTPSDIEYPEKLKRYKTFPKELYAIGNMELLNKLSIAIVGTRNINNYGIIQTERFASYLSQKGITIVSGLANGVDTVAHTNSMEYAGKTIAVVASGFNHIFPKNNEILFEKIIENGGLIISEYKPDEDINMSNFHKRNRIISRLAEATLVTEAGIKSGSTLTAHITIKDKKLVFCIPGNITDAVCRGCNLLISEGAILVESPKEIIEYLEIDEKLIDDSKIKPAYKEVYQLMNKTTPISVNEICQITKKKIQEVSEILLMLETDGFIQEKGYNTYIRGGSDKY